MPCEITKSHFQQMEKATLIQNQKLIESAFDNPSTSVHFTVSITGCEVYFGC